MQKQEARQSSVQRKSCDNKAQLVAEKIPRGGFMVLFEVIIRTREIWSQGKDIINDLYHFN